MHLQRRDLVRVMRVLHRREAYKRSYWARQEVPQLGEPSEPQTTENSGNAGA